MQNPLTSKCKMTPNIYIYYLFIYVCVCVCVLLLYEWCVFFYLWCLEVKYVQFTFQINPCNYHNLILDKTMWFLYELMNTKFCTKFIQTYEA
jgi:hypothetical protein